MNITSRTSQTQDKRVVETIRCSECNTATVVDLGDSGKSQYDQRGAFINGHRNCSVSPAPQGGESVEEAAKPTKRVYVATMGSMQASTKAADYAEAALEVAKTFFGEDVHQALRIDGEPQTPGQFQAYDPPEGGSGETIEVGQPFHLECRSTW